MFFKLSFFLNLGQSLPHQMQYQPQTPVATQPSIARPFLVTPPMPDLLHSGNADTRSVTMQNQGQSSAHPDPGMSSQRCFDGPQTSSRSDGGMFEQVANMPGYLQHAGPSTHAQFQQHVQLSNSHDSGPNSQCRYNGPGPSMRENLQHLGPSAPHQGPWSKSPDSGPHSQQRFNGTPQPTLGPQESINHQDWTAVGQMQKHQADGIELKSPNDGTA